MSSATDANFVETLEHQRFAEFCDACCRYRYRPLLRAPRGGQNAFDPPLLTLGSDSRSESA
jgi:hypothetical protein